MVSLTATRNTTEGARSAEFGRPPLKLTLDICSLILDSVDDLGESDVRAIEDGAFSEVMKSKYEHWSGLLI
jgi:hypothetical protein